MRIVQIEFSHRLLAPRLVTLLGTRDKAWGSNIIPITNCTSISIAPPLVAIAVYHSWCSCSALLSADGFTLSIPTIDDLELVWKLGGRYSGYCEVSTTPKLIEFRERLDESFSPYGPVLTGAIAWLECVKQQVVETGGDHMLFIGQVVRAKGQPVTHGSDAYLETEPKPFMQWTGNRFCTSMSSVSMNYYGGHADVSRSAEEKK